MLQEKELSSPMFKELFIFQEATLQVWKIKKSLVFWEIEISYILGGNFKVQSLKKFITFFLLFLQWIYHIFLIFSKNKFTYLISFIFFIRITRMISYQNNLLYHIKINLFLCNITGTQNIESLLLCRFFPAFTYVLLCTNSLLKFFLDDIGNLFWNFIIFIKKIHTLNFMKTHFWIDYV